MAATRQNRISEAIKKVLNFKKSPIFSWAPPPPLPELTKKLEPLKIMLFQLFINGMPYSMLHCFNPEAYVFPLSAIKPTPGCDSFIFSKKGTFLQGPLNLRHKPADLSSLSR